MKITVVCKDGIERKSTLFEFFNQPFPTVYAKIISVKRGEWVRGTPKSCMEDLDKYYYGTCVQKIEIDTANDCTVVYVR